jgi:hypothetical protein
MWLSQQHCPDEPSFIWAESLWLDVRTGLFDQGHGKLNLADETQRSSKLTYVPRIRQLQIHDFGKITLNIRGVQLD